MKRSTLYIMGVLLAAFGAQCIGAGIAGAQKPKPKTPTKKPAAPAKKTGKPAAKPAPPVAPATKP